MPGLYIMSTTKFIRKQINDAHVKTYYLYERQLTKDGNVLKKPVVTVCLMFVPELNEWARGVAICSPKDSPNKVKGRIIARMHASKLIAAKHLVPQRHMHRILSSDVEILLAYNQNKLRGNLPLQHDYVPVIRNNEFMQKLLTRATATTRGVILSEEDRDLENELNPRFTPHELRLIAADKHPKENAQ